MHFVLFKAPNIVYSWAYFGSTFSRVTFGNQIVHFNWYIFVCFIFEWCGFCHNFQHKIVWTKFGFVKKIVFTNQLFTIFIFISCASIHSRCRVQASSYQKHQIAWNAGRVWTILASFCWTQTGNGSNRFIWIQCIPHDDIDPFCTFSYQKYNRLNGRMPQRWFHIHFASFLFNLSTMWSLMNTPRICLHLSLIENTINKK